MDITEASIVHHIGIVLVLLWILSSFSCCHPVLYFISLIYLYQVHERYILRLRKKLQFEERKQANQRRVLSDSETVRWLNHAVEQIWPICMEQIASQKILLPIIPWFLEKYKPWTAKKAVVQSLYLGRNPPVFTEIRVLRQSDDDDHLVLELGMNFLTADDMSAILAVKLRKRLGFGIWAKLHVTGMHVEGKVLIGVKFLREWPFLGRLRICFVEPPYFQMTVKPIFNHGVDVTEIPGIAGWMDKLLAVAFEQTLVEPNMLVVDMEKFVSSPKGGWFSVDEREPIAHARVEIIEAADMKPSDPNGFADPYVKGKLGPYRFRTKTQKKTLAPKWQEEFKIPICTWESSNMLALEVRDKDHLYDDTLGDCSININDLRGGQRLDMWLSLQNIKMGRLHLAVTVIDTNGKGEEHLCNKETPSSNKKEDANPGASKTTQRASDSAVSSEQASKMEDKFEPINIEGQQQTGIWVHQPGNDISPTWKPRKGKSRQVDTQIRREDNDSTESSRSTASGILHNDNNDTEKLERNTLKPLNTVRRGLHKIGSVFRKSPREEDQEITGDAIPEHVNLRAVDEEEIGVKFIVDDNLYGAVSANDSKTDEKSSSPDRSSQESPGKGNMKGMAKSILKHAGKSAHSLKHALSKKNSNKSKGNSGSVSTEIEDHPGFDSSDEESLSSSKVYSPRVQGIPIDATPISGYGQESPNVMEQSGVDLYDSAINIEEPLARSVSVRGVEGADDNMVTSPDVNREGLEESLNSKLPKENSEAEKR